LAPAGERRHVVLDSRRFAGCFNQEFVVLGGQYVVVRLRGGKGGDVVQWGKQD
jgi:hypothetical protein